MKKLAFILGTTGVIIILLQLLFKLHHWEYAGTIIRYGTLFNFIIVLPVAAVYALSLKNKKMLFFGACSAYVLLGGLLFKFFHWPASQIIYACGTLLVIIFVILYAIDLYKKEL